MPTIRPTVETGRSGNSSRRRFDAQLFPPAQQRLAGVDAHPDGMLVGRHADISGDFCDTGNRFEVSPGLFPFVHGLADTEVPSMLFSGRIETQEF